MKFIKKKIESIPERSLKYLLHRHLAGVDEARSIKTIHASELTRSEGFCPRAYALMDVTKTKPRNSWITTSEAVTYRIGRDLQDDVVNWFADMGRAVGHWLCVSCKRLHEFQKRPAGCELCGCKVFKPEEVRFVSALTGASCGIDMMLDLGEPRLRPVEVKTIDKEKFKSLVAPLAEHRLRTNLYLRIIEESEHPWSARVNDQTASVLYVSKGGYGCLDDQLKKWGLKEGFSPFKEYKVVREDKKTEDVSRRARAVKLFRDGEVGMPEGVCATALCQRAKSCPVVKHCFSGKYPAEYQWAEVVS